MKAIRLITVFQTMAGYLVAVSCFTLLAAEDPIAVADRGVVRVLVKHGKTFGEGTALGTGFVVTSDGFVVTNNHVISPPGEVFVLVKQANANAPTILPAQITWASTEYDLALLKVSGLQSTPLTISDKLPLKGSKVFAIGYPGIADRLLDRPDVNLNSLAESTFSEGLLGRVFAASWSQSGEKINILQHGAAINKGNSGGPLLDSCGHVVGVNTELELGSVIGNPQDGAEVIQANGIFYASHVAVLLKELKRKGLAVSISSEGCNPSISQTGTTESNLGPPPPPQTDWIMLSATGAGVLVALLALLVAFKKRTVVQETFTQYKRRSEAVQMRPPLVKTYPRLILRGQGSAGQAIRVVIDAKKCNSSALVIGRDVTQSDLRIDDPTVSRRHASITWLDGRWMLCDLGSKNSTTIDGIIVGSRASPLRVGQSVEFGKVTLRAKEDQS